MPEQTTEIKRIKTVSFQMDWNDWLRLRRHAGDNDVSISNVICSHLEPTLKKIRKKYTEFGG